MQEFLWNSCMVEGDMHEMTHFLFVKGESLPCPAITGISKSTPHVSLEIRIVILRFEIFINNIDAKSALRIKECEELKHQYLGYATMYLGRDKQLDPCSDIVTGITKLPSS